MHLSEAAGNQGAGAPGTRPFPPHRRNKKKLTMIAA
jgi:hypothetical protein